MRLNRILTVAAAGAGLALLVGLGLRQPDVDALPASRPPVVSFSGPHSAVTSEAYHFATTQDDFAKLWINHVGDKGERLVAHGSGVFPPEIDFTRFAVVAYFRGHSTNCDGERVTAIDEFDDHVRIRFDSMTFQTSSFSGEDPGEAVTPYGIWVIPRSKKMIVIEENTQGLIGRDPIWTQRQRFNSW